MKINRSSVIRWGIYLGVAPAIAVGLAWGAAQRQPPAAEAHGGCGMMVAVPQGAGSGCGMDAAECARRMSGGECGKTGCDMAPQGAAKGKRAAGGAACPMDQSECGGKMPPEECRKKMSGKAAGGCCEAMGTPQAKPGHEGRPVKGSADAKARGHKKHAASPGAGGREDAHEGCAMQGGMRWAPGGDGQDG